MSGPINNPAEIIPIGVADAPMLSALAKEIYREYYLHLWYPGGADWYMHEHAYHPDKLAAELADSNHLHFIVREKDNTAGYLTIRLRSSFGVHDEKNTMEIERIYLHKAFAGKGIGRQLMLHAGHIAREQNKKYIFLKAMDSSHDAIAFYTKMGYDLAGTYTLPFPQMKEQLRGMVILGKVVD